MNKPSFGMVAVTALISAVAGAAGGAFVASNNAPQAAGTAAASPSNDARLEALAAQVRDNSKSIDELLAAVRALPSADTRVSTDDVALEAALARYLAKHPGTATTSAAAAPLDATLAARAHNGEVADLLSRLLDENLSDDEREGLWREVREKGLLDEVVAQLERRAELDPSNPDRQVDLGNAYLQKVFAAGAGPEAGVWATKADKRFDEALAVDANHWDARFTKAIALSNWPAFLGKQPEAIKHFETLLEQQSAQPKEARYAYTHLFLGNMYLQMGQKDKALSTWEGGLAQFPDNDELRKRIELTRAQ